VKNLAQTISVYQGLIDLDAIASVKQRQRRDCKECAKIEADWVHLRACQTCGITLCCDSSPTRHTTKYAHATGGSVIASSERGERCSIAILTTCSANN